MNIGKHARWLFPVVIALFFQAIAFMLSQFREPIGLSLYGWIWSLGSVFMMWEIGRWVGKHYSSRLKDHPRVWLLLIQQFTVVTTLQGVIFTLTFVLMNYYENAIAGYDNPLSIMHLLLAFSFSVVISLMINTIQMGYQLISHSQQSQLEANQFKHESVLANLENLKQQIDPHFMFNNFSTLHGLIYEDADKAGNYLLKLSDVYRQVLTSLSKERHTLADELTLIEPYTDLLRIRYGNQLHFDLQIPEELLHKNIITMGLQIPIENAIKHNKIDEQHELFIHIKAQGHESITIENNLQKRTSLPHSHGIGLENLNTRCQYLCGRSIEKQQTQKSFIIDIPIW